jgi:hypothetical protein
MGDKKDIPCTLSIQFFIRDGRLHCVTTMRSNDIWLGLPYDIFCFTCLQRLIAEALKVPTGFYIHQAGSLHLYARNAEKMDTASNKPSIVEAEHQWTLHETPISQATHDAIEFEADWRHGGVGDVIQELKTKLNEGSMLYDLALLCAAKWQDVRPSHIKSNSLKEAYDAYYRGNGPDGQDHSGQGTGETALFAE